MRWRVYSYGKRKEMHDNYKKWIDERVREAVKGFREGSETLNGYMSENGFFVTLTFNRRLLAAKRLSGDQESMGSYSLEWWELNRLYNVVRRRLLGPNYSRKEDLAPVALVGLDVEGTRYGLGINSIRNVHFHSIWVLPPGYSDAFRDAMTQAAVDPKFAFDSIRVDRVNDYNKGGTLALPGYVGKFCERNTARAQVAHDFLILPLGRSPV